MQRRYIIDPSTARRPKIKAEIKSEGKADSLLVSLGICTHTHRLRSSHQISPSEQENDGTVALNNHTERRRPSLAVGLGSLLLHGPFAMEHRGRQANHE